MPRYIFLRTAWMKHYKGVTDDDIPTGAGSYVEENHNGGEVYNFYPIGRNYYGYVRIQNGRSLRIEKLGSGRDDDFIDDVSVILFAKNPETGGQYIIGWYLHARLFRSVQTISNNKFPDRKSYMVKAEVVNSYLVPEDARIKLVEGPGQTNAWYVEDYVDQNYFQDLESYISDPENYIVRLAKKKRGGRGWQKDIELRKAVEIKAMDTIAEYFEVRNYNVKYCHTENFGWDMEANSGKQTLLLEVKGLSSHFVSIDFTPNEYKMSKINKKHYRICVVSNALDNNKRGIDIFYHEDGNWVSKDNKHLKTTEIISAQFSLK